MRIGLGIALPSVIQNSFDDDMASPYVLKLFHSNTNHIDHGPFWPVGEDIAGDFFWEFWCAPDAGAEYLISEGNGGAHAILFGFGGGAGTSSYITPTGNIYDGVITTTSFAGFDGVAAGEACHVAVGWDGTKIVVYVNGVPCGVKAFTGPRQAQYGQLYIGGSDHSNFNGKLAAARGFEGTHPIKVFGSTNAFRPSCPFPAFYVNGAGDRVDAAFLGYYDRPFSRIIEDLSAGYGGSRHHGIIRSGGNGLDAADYREVPDSFPVGEWVKDTSFPQNRYLSESAIPTSLLLTPPATPSGALIFDSFSRANQTKAFTNFPSLGETESGSLGPQTWDVGAFGPYGSCEWGIQNGRAFSYAINAGLALVDAHTANHEIRCDHYEPNYATGEIAVAFRVVDRSNMLLVSNYAYGLDTGARTLYFWTLIDGVLTQVAGASPPSSWQTLRIVANGTTIDVYCDSTRLHHLTGVTTCQTGTKVGMAAYTCAYFGLMRWDNFTVLAA